MPEVLPCDIPMSSGQLPRVRFMIAAIDNRRAICLQPVSERQRWMVQVMGDYFDVLYMEGSFDKIVITNCSCELIRRDGKVGVLHLTGERFTQGLVETLGTVDVPLIGRHEERGEERDPLDVIPVRVADEDMTAQTVGAARHQILTEGMCAGPAVNDDECSACRAHLNARCISSVTSRARSGLGNRTASAPELYPHVAS